MNRFGWSARAVFEKPDGGASGSWDGALDQRIQRKAHEIWVSEGQPHGQDRRHWDMARELIAIEDNQAGTLIPVDENRENPVEPPEAFENQGEFPDLTDQGEGAPGPSFDNLKPDK